MRSPFPPHHEITTWRLVIGIVLVLVGISGFILPILPGWVLFFVGLALLGIGSSTLATRIKRNKWAAKVSELTHIDKIDFERLKDIDPEVELGKLPPIYRNITFSCLVVLQALIILLSAAAYRNYFDPSFVPFISASRALLYVFPSIVFFLGVAGLFTAINWKTHGADIEHDLWEHYFNIEIVGFPLFWALMLLLNVL